MDEILIERFGIRENVNKYFWYIKWYDSVRNAETGQYSFNPFPGLAYPEYPAFTNSILEGIKDEYILYRIEKHS